MRTIIWMKAHRSTALSNIRSAWFQLSILVKRVLLASKNALAMAHLIVMDRRCPNWLDRLEELDVG